MESKILTSTFFPKNCHFSPQVFGQAKKKDSQKKHQNSQVNFLTGKKKPLDGVYGNKISFSFRTAKDAKIQISLKNESFGNPNSEEGRLSHSFEIRAIGPKRGGGGGGEGGKEGKGGVEGEGEGKKSGGRGRTGEISTPGAGNSLKVTFVGGVEGGETEKKREGENLAEEAEETVDEIADVADKTTKVVEREVNLAAGEAGASFEAVRKDSQNQIEELAPDLEKAAKRVSELSQESLEEVRGQVEEGVDDFGSQVEEQVSSLSSLSEFAQKELQRQREIIENRNDKVVSATRKTGKKLKKEGEDLGEAVVKEGENLGGKILETGEDSVKAVGDLIGVVGGVVGEGIEDLTGERGRGGESGELANPEAPEGGEREEEVKPMGDPGAFKGIKAFVAGAGGRTGRKISEQLASKSVPVRALVRNVRRESYLGQILGVQVVEGDIYNYGETVKALGDSNVILCAVGVQPSPMDPLGPYKEYEGIKNLIAAAKNKGDVKKFIFVTSLGVSNLLIPFNLFWGLLFWKKQAELELERSGLDYTIVRPGGLKEGYTEREAVIMRSADSLLGGSISRLKVAQVCVEALVTPAASRKIVEIISEDSSVKKPLFQLFSEI